MFLISYCSIQKHRNESLIWLTTTKAYALAVQLPKKTARLMLIFTFCQGQWTIGAYRVFFADEKYERSSRCVLSLWINACEYSNMVSQNTQTHLWTHRISAHTYTICGDMLRRKYSLLCCDTQHNKCGPTNQPTTRWLQHTIRGFSVRSDQRSMCRAFAITTHRHKKEKRA